MSNTFNKKLFAILLEKAKGDRSWKEFSDDCKISYVQMRKLVTQKQENPPRLKLIRSISAASQNGITIDDFLFLSGINEGRTPDTTFQISSSMMKQGDLFYEKYLSLSMGQRKMINEFIDFLSGREN